MWREKLPSLGGQKENGGGAIKRGGEGRRPEWEKEVHPLSVFRKKGRALSSALGGGRDPLKRREAAPAVSSRYRVG